jgi:hypothetical protein
MTDVDDLVAVCCLAGADADVTLEELQALRGLAGRIGLERKSLDDLVFKCTGDEQFREEQVDAVRRDTDGTMKKLILLAREDESFREGYLSMLLWRVATKLDVSAEHFEELMAAADGSR